MKKFAMILAAALTVGATAFAQPQGGPGGPGGRGPGFGPGQGGPGAPGQEQNLTSEQKTRIAKEYTDKMNSTLTLSDKQYKKAYKANKKYADVLPPIKRQQHAKPVKGGPGGPRYDTPGRPHPSGNNGVPGSWSKNDGDKPTLQKKQMNSEEADAATGATVPEEGFGQGPAGGKSEGAAPDGKALKKIEKRRTAYDKKISKVLTAEQNEVWATKVEKKPAAEK